MKELILVYDGMADRAVPALDGHTPMEVAKKPTMDMLAAQARIGTVLNVPAGMVPESDTANLAILSYDPRTYSRGRSPLEAVSMGLTMLPDETAYRFNLVALSDDDNAYEDKIILDHSSDEIPTNEARLLVEAIEEAFGNEERHFYTGVSYRHCLLWKNSSDTFSFTRPHDILGSRIGDYLPQGEEGKRFYDLMRASFDVLNHHPVNESRRARGLKPANSIWLWSPGKKPALPSFREKWGVDATAISAVDLIKGIALCAGMESVDVEGATGNLHTNYAGKAAAAIDAYRRGKELVFIHVEAPDECGHLGDTDGKVRSIELIDEKILRPVYEYLVSTGEHFRILALPDHPTPLVIRTHSSEPVPFMLYDNAHAYNGVNVLTEAAAEAKHDYLPDGTALMSVLLEK